LSTEWFARSQKGDQEKTQKHRQPGEDAVEVVADGAEDCVCGIANAAFEKAAPEMTFGFHMADGRLDADRRLSWPLITQKTPRAFGLR
jgi:hypothetical protein